MSICIDQCYCEKKTFEELLEIAECENLDIHTLSAKTGCGTHCGWCIAYLRRALQTGEISFNYLLPKETLMSENQK